jgi:hypothetical protein
MIGASHPFAVRSLNVRDENGLEGCATCGRPRSVHPEGPRPAFIPAEDATIWPLPEDAGAPRIAPEPPGEAGPGDDTSQALTRAEDGARERPGAVPALPLGAGSEDAREGDGELPELRIPPGKPISDEDVAELRERFAEAMKGRPVILPSDRWRERAEAAEATVAEIEAHCRKHAEHAHLHCPDLGMAPVALVKAVDILAIIGTGEESRA